MPIPGTRVQFKIGQFGVAKFNQFPFWLSSDAQFKLMDSNNFFELSKTPDILK